MPSVRTRCTHCGRGLTIKKPELVGRKAACPSCGKGFVIRPVNSPAKKRRKKPVPADDGILEAEIVEAEEVEAASGGDDDWLSELDALPPKDPVGTPVAAEAPRVTRSSRKKKSSSRGKSKKKRRRLRDPDGEMPLWLHRVLMIACGIIAGAIVTGLWAGLISRSGSPSRFMAVLVGVLVGTAVRLGASKWDFGWWPALTASIIVFISIFAGKISGYHLMKHQAAVEAAEQDAAYLTMLKHEDFPIHQIAEDIEYEQAEITGEFFTPSERWEDEAMERFTNSDGTTNWAEVHNPAYFPERHAESWEAARQRWEQMPEDEKNEHLESIAQQIAFYESGDRQEYAQLYDDYDTNIYGTRIITPWDFIFSIIAIIAAFKIAAGMNDDEEESGVF